MKAAGWGASSEHPLFGAVDTVVAALEGSADPPLWSLSDRQVEDRVRMAHRARAQADELVLRLVADVARRRTGERSGATSTRAWLRRELQVAPADAKRDVELAAALAGPLELTRQALAAGDLSRAHAWAVVRVMDTLPADLSSPARAEAERQLIDWSRQFDPLDVAKLGRRLWEVIDPEAADQREGQLLERQEREARRTRHLTFGGDGFGRSRLVGRFDAESAAMIVTALDPLAKPLPSTVDGPDPRTPGQRYADALVELCRRQVAGGDLPSRGGEKPQIVVTMDLHKLRRRIGSGLLDTGDRLSPDTIRRLACDAQLIPALLGTDGRPLDLGRTARTFTPAQRRGLGLRDGNGCAFPGCDRPMAWCDGHHIRHWVDGGPTDLDNGALLCCHHHTLVHRGDWVIRMAADRRPEFIPPGWIDPDRRPLRNHRHRLE